MIKIRLARTGARNDPHYRIVAIEKSRKRGGKPLDILGHWYPAKNESKIDKKKLKEWIAKGAQISEAVEALLLKKRK
jgi:small subunit ribosomal protein S16